MVPPAMRLAAAAIAAAVLAAPAAGARAADIPGSTATRATLPVAAEPKQGTFEIPSDSDWYRVKLGKGQDVALVCADGLYASCRLRDARGRIVAEATEGSVYDVQGVEFRAPAAGTYFAEYENINNDEVVPPFSYSAEVAPDCRRDRTTTCALRPGVTQRRQIAYSVDEDWFRVSLAKGKAYDITLAYNTLAYDIDYALVDARGKVLARPTVYESGKVVIRGFRPGKAGTYYVRVAGLEEASVAYQVTLGR